MNNPEYIKIGDTKYKINTDYRIALKCNDIATDKSISDYEKAIGVVYTLFNIEKDLSNEELEKALKLALKYLQARPGKNSVKTDKIVKDMDYKQDWGLILASIWQQYGIDLSKEKLHWWTFFDLLNGLSSDCILNRVRDIRTKDISKIKDEETRKTYLKLKQAYKLEEPKEELTDKEKESVETFYRLTGIGRK